MKVRIVVKPAGVSAVTRMLDDMSFAVVPGSPRSPVVLHVPHASRTIPPDVRASILLDDAALELELDAMTDVDTDQIAARARARVGDVPWLVQHGVSRLVVDPERFPDEREEMVEVGMGAVYTRTSDQRLLRAADTVRDAELLARYFTPYAEALTRVVDERLAATGAAVLLDVHSYPRDPLPYERHAGDRRPAVCLGVDDQHTPGWLLDAAREAFAVVGETVVDEPFRGTYVPLAHHGRDRRVSSLMVELRRDVYAGDLSVVVAALARLAEVVEDAGRGRMGG